jgi:hypothetical protein
MAYLVEHLVLPYSRDVLLQILALPEEDLLDTNTLAYFAITLWLKHNLLVLINVSHWHPKLQCGRLQPCLKIKDLWPVL